MADHSAANQNHTQWMEKYANDPEFIAEGLALVVTDEALDILSERGLTQSWLAENMGMSRQRVSRIFNATPNLTLLSISRIAAALNVPPKMILDSKHYLIHPIDEIFDFEAYKTEAAIQMSKYSVTNAQDTTVALPPGALQNALA